MRKTFIMGKWKTLRGFTWEKAGERLNMSPRTLEDNAKTDFAGRPLELAMRFVEMMEAPNLDLAAEMLRANYRKYKMKFPVK